MIRVLLIDDHAIVRDGLHRLVDAEADMQVVGEASDAASAQERAATLAPDVIVLDLSLPGGSGLQLARDLRTSCPAVALLILTRHAEPAYVREVMASGARGYVLKQSPSRDLLSGIRVVSQGRVFLDVAVTPRGIEDVVRAKGRLTARETDVLRLSALGHSHREVGTMLGIAEKTVEVHKANAMRKLELHDRAALIQHAALQGWLEAS